MLICYDLFVFSDNSARLSLAFLAKLHAATTMKSPFAKLFSDLRGSKALTPRMRLTSIDVGTEMQARCKPVKPVEKCKILLRNQRASVGLIATYAERASHFALTTWTFGNEKNKHICAEEH